MERRWLLSAASPTSPPVLAASTATATTANLTAEETSVSQSVDAFALDLYAQLQSTTGGNLFVSPFSIATALAMSYAGAGGQTAQQMASVLHLGSDASSVEDDFGALLNDLDSSGQSGGYLLSIANSLWAQEGVDILPEFLNVIQSDFGGLMNEADFIDDAETARQTINDWVAQQTHDKIQNLFPPGSIDTLTRLVLANAIYFKGNWSSEFDAGLTRDASFTLASGSQVTASTMHKSADFRYMESDGFQVLELPYANGRLAMDILLPTQTGLASLGSNQVPADIATWLGGLSGTYVQVSLPKFTMTTELDLVPPLQKLGMTDAFINDVADFSGIGNIPHNHIDSVMHKAFISINETGTEAAAATGTTHATAAGIEVPPNPPVIFNADHPFLFLIRDTQSSTLLFMGQVENPNQGDSDPSAPVITQQPRSQDPTQNAVAPIGTSPVTIPPPLMGPIYTALASTPSLSSSEKLVDAFYRSLLGRTAESTALTYWSKLLDGGASRAGVVGAIESSAEYREDQVESLYQHYFGRSADTAGLGYFADQLASGTTIEQVAATLAGSPEFAEKHGGAANLVDAFFSAILGRTADVSAGAHFLADAGDRWDRPAGRGPASGERRTSAAIGRRDAD